MTKDAEASDGKRIHIIILTTINEKDEKIIKKRNLVLFTSILKGFLYRFFFVYSLFYIPVTMHRFSESHPAIPT